MFEAELSKVSGACEGTEGTCSSMTNTPAPRLKLNSSSVLQEALTLDPHLNTFGLNWTSGPSVSDLTSFPVAERTHFQNRNPTEKPFLKGQSSYKSKEGIYLEQDVQQAQLGVISQVSI